MSVDSFLAEDVPPPRVARTPLDWRAALLVDGAVDVALYQRSERMLARGQSVFTQGQNDDYVYVLLAGWISLDHVMPDGSCQITDFALPGSLLGHQRVLEGAFSVSASCVTDVWLLMFPRRRLLDLIRGHDHLYALYEATLADEAARAQRHLANVTRRRGLARLVNLVVELVERAAAVRVDEDPLTLPVNQIQLASALGLTNVYISRLAKSLSSQGLIDWRSRRLRVLDFDGLRAVANAG